MQVSKARSLPWTRWSRGPQTRFPGIGLVLVALCLALSACGKMGGTSPPGPPDQVKWPHIYPTQ